MDTGLVADVGLDVLEWLLLKVVEIDQVVHAEEEVAVATVLLKK